MRSVHWVKDVKTLLIMTAVLPSSMVQMTLQNDLQHISVLHIVTPRDHLFIAIIVRSCLLSVVFRELWFSVYVYVLYESILNVLKFVLF